MRDSGHALLTDFPAGTSVQVGFVAAFEELYDQAGLLVRVDERTWVKAAVEISDELLQLGAVVTRCEDGPWRMIRLAPLAPDAWVTAGPFC